MLSSTIAAPIANLAEASVVCVLESSPTLTSAIPACALPATPNSKFDLVVNSP